MSVTLFYSLSILLVVLSLLVVLCRNPLHSALFLALAMIDLAFVFMLLKAPFIAAVQLMVYAGAVMVMFVMVLMLFDLKETKESAFSGNMVTNGLKLISATILCAALGSQLFNYRDVVGTALGSGKEFSVKMLGAVLYTKYIFAFEALGVLLLLIAVGAVALSRAKGGTHEQVEVQPKPISAKGGKNV